MSDAAEIRAAINAAFSSQLSRCLGVYSSSTDLSEDERAEKLLVCADRALSGRRILLALVDKVQG